MTSFYNDKRLNLGVFLQQTRILVRYYRESKEHGGHMVKRGSSHLRYTLMNLCIPLIQYNMVFAEYYQKKRHEGKTHRVACSHLVKKLIRVIYTLEKNNIDFDSSKLR